MLKSQIKIFAGRRGVDSQLLMLSPKMLKSPKFTFSQVGEGAWQPTFDAESKNAKIPNSHLAGGKCWQPTFDAESKNPNFIFLQVWRRGSVGSQLLMLSPEMLKSQIHIFTRVNGWWSTFDAESKNPKIPNSHFCRCGKGEGWQPTFDAESRNAKIPNSHFCRWGGLAANF